MQNVLLKKLQEIHVNGTIGNCSDEFIKHSSKDPTKQASDVVKTTIQGTLMIETMCGIITISVKSILNFDS